MSSAHVVVAEYGCATVQDPPGASSQNSYWGLAQAVDAAVKVTTAGGPCGGAALGASDALRQAGAPSWKSVIANAS